MLNKIVYRIQKLYSKDVSYDAISFALQAEVYRQSKQYKKAIDLITKSIVFDDKNDTFYYSRAILFFYQNKFKFALKDIETAININPNIYYYYLIKSDIFSMLNDSEKELENIKKAFDLMPKAHLYYSYKIEKYNRNSNYYLPEFYKNRDKIIKEKYINLSL